MSGAVCKSGDPSGLAPANKAAPDPLFDTAIQDENIEAYDYPLPPERIAQRPADRRDASRLLVHHRASGLTSHLSFADLPRQLLAGDLLVVNDTRVIPARIHGAKETGGKVEILLIDPLGGGDWEAMVRPSARVRPGQKVHPARGGEPLIVGEALESGHRRVHVPPEVDLERVGEPPLPPYIRRPDGLQDDDRERYQTVYAVHDGAVAAPTAGLHFTEGVFEALRDRGVDVAEVTLHVGVGTFEPVRASNLDDHVMHAERYRVPPATARAVEAVRARGGRIVAVGTTVVRTLEAWSREGRPDDGVPRSTDLFIRPGFDFREVGAMLTNFHLPRSTLVALVAAWAGRERILGLYEEAVEAEYRFYSYGDAMLLL